MSITSGETGGKKLEMEKILFKEEQRFTQWWIWLLLIFSFAVSVGPIWYGFFKQISTGVPWGDNPTSDTGLAIIGVLTTLLMVGILFVFKITRLKVEIRDNGIYFRFPPLVRKWRIVSKDEIERYTVGKYSPVGEYGGWGVRRSYGKYGRAYNVSGNLGLRLYLKNGKVLLLGTQRTQAISSAMQKMMSGREQPL
jgi:hypothetical protein